MTQDAFNLPLVNQLNCESENCEDPEAVGEFLPVLTFSNGATVVFNTAVCGDCRKSLTVEDYLTEALWASIVAAESDAKQTAPRRAQTKLTFNPVDDGQTNVAAMSAAAEDSTARPIEGGNQNGGGFEQRRFGR